MAKDSFSDVDFSALVLGFSSAALSYMGYGTVATGEVSANLSLAKQNIAIIQLLKEKTVGNLTEDEKKLIDDLLTDLRLKYAEAAKK